MSANFVGHAFALNAAYLEDGGASFGEENVVEHTARSAHAPAHAVGDRCRRGSGIRLRVHTTANQCAIQETNAAKMSGRQVPLRTRGYEGRSARIARAPADKVLPQSPSPTRVSLRRAKE